ncbi:MAG: c-type cytochrome [Magnetospirillum sp. WYHS-4]
MRILPSLAVGFLLAAAGVGAQQPGETPISSGPALPKGDPARGARLAAERCIECHDVSGAGKGLHRPNLAGQKEPYLVKQLLSYQASSRGAEEQRLLGWRWHPRMASVGGGMTGSDIADLAAHFSGRACLGSGTRPQPRPEIAERCNLCHGPHGRGLYPTIPNIAGQKELYLLRQLDAFRARGKAVGTGDTEVRRSNPMMDRQAHLLSENEIVLLSAYFSGLPCA